MSAVLSPRKDIHRSTRLLRSLLDASREALVAIDESGEIVFANRAAHILWGYPEGQMLGHSLGALFAPQFEFLQVQNGATNNGVDTDAEARRPDGARFAVSVNLREIGAEGATFRVLTASDDFGARERELARARVHTFDALEQFASGLAHEFNNVLTGVLGNIDLAMEECGRRGRLQPTLLEAAHNAGLRARELTRQLLEFARGQRPDQSSVCLPDLTRENCLVALHGSCCKCEFDFPDDLPAAYLDPAQFGQVMHTLINFVDELTCHSGKLKISARAFELENEEEMFGGELLLGDYCSLTIEATGGRFTPEEVERLFEPYSQRGPLATGLDLATCRAIVSRHGGVIHAFAGADGKLTIEMLLPSSSDVPSRAVTPLNSGVPNAQGANILVMDDEQLVRTVLQRTLEGLGHRVTACMDGQDAIEKYAEALERDDRFDMVFLDISIPGGMGGREACEELLMMDPLATCVVISGDTSDQLMVDYDSFGFVARLDKPFDVQDMARLVDKIAGDREDYFTRMESTAEYDDEDDLALPFEDNIVTIDFSGVSERY